MVKYKVKDGDELRRIVNRKYPEGVPFHDDDEEYRRFEDLPLSELDVSEVKDMCHLFRNITNFNEDISNWDMGKVEMADQMFDGCEQFNQDISDWDMGSINSMELIFHGCKSFNADISKWNLREAEDLSYALFGCSRFNQPIGNWELPSAKYMDHMLGDCLSFNQDLSKWGKLTGTSKTGILDGCSGFDFKNLGDLFKGGKKSDCLLREEDLNGRGREELMTLMEAFGGLNEFERKTFERMGKGTLRERIVERYCYERRF